MKYSNYKNNKGVTLVALIITILVLIVLAGIAITYGINTLRDVSNDTTSSELSIVQTAIVQRYALAKSKLELIPTMRAKYESTESERTSSGLDKVLVGTIMTDVSKLEEKGFNDYHISYGSSKANRATDISYDSLYYLLENDDLVDLGIEKKDYNDSLDRSYIVNYATGEVFDVVNKVYYDTDNYDSTPIYIPSSDSVIINNQIDDNYIDE